MAEKEFDWAKFDKGLNLPELQKEVEKAAEGGDYPEIPVGEYEVKLESLEMVESKKKDPMLKTVFEILEGEFKGQKIFVFGVMQPNNDKAWGMQVHRNNEMLRGLSEEEVKFNGFKDYNEIVLDIAEEFVGAEYLLKKDTNKSGFDSYEILEMFD